MAKRAYEVSPGLKLDFAMPAAVTSGSGVLIGGVFGFAVTDGALGERVTLGLTGVWADVDKASGEAWTEGQNVYWDSTNERVTTTAGANKKIGFARFAAAAADTLGTIRLNGISV